MKIKQHYIRDFKEIYKKTESNCYAFEGKTILVCGGAGFLGGYFYYKFISEEKNYTFVIRFLGVFYAYFILGLVLNWVFTPEIAAADFGFVLSELSSDAQNALLRDFTSFFVATFLLVILGVAAAFVASQIIDKNFFTLLLSYCPGGIYEVAVIAIFFDLDPEFVSFHHIIRLLMILFAVPLILKIISKKA